MTATASRDSSPYSPADRGQLADPYAGYAWLREHDPVHHHVEAGLPEFWALTRFADVWDAVRRPQVFSSAHGLTFHPDEIGELGLPPTMVMLDPPVHTRLRGLIGRGFTPRRIALLENDIRRYARSLIAELGDEFDLHRDYATRVPTHVLAELLGVPVAERERFDPWVAALTTLQDNGFDPSALTAPGAVAEMMDYFQGVIDERRVSPREDLIGTLVSAEIDGERLSDWDILGFCFVMVAGGNDTTGALIAHTIALLDRHPDQRELLLEDPGLTEPAVVESLRLESSVQGLARYTTEDAVVDGVTIPAGSKVMMMYAAANRDPAEFGPTADDMDIRRRPARHLAFSSGPHFCIGNHLARLQARVAVEELLTSCPEVSVDEAAGTRALSAFTRGWSSLPARVR